QESKKLATDIQSNLFNNRRVQDVQVQNYGIKTAPFVVLSQTEVPSVLVEISCITNLKEEKKLTSSRYRSMVAAHMEAGVVTYLESDDSKLLIGEK
ncbi:MAG: N-acetylmuramoyl-L-alanine amidase family protein, partial [Desulfosudaceae bacterium]